MLWFPQANILIEIKAIILKGSSWMTCVTSHRIETISGTLMVLGDKSISHRALMVGASAVGETKIFGLLEAEDVMATAQALRILGVNVQRNDDGSWSVIGRGVGGLSEPKVVLDMGNSGTGARLLMGLVAAHPFNTIFSGDTSLCARPMGRVISPLRRMGAGFNAHSGDTLPLIVHGSDMLCPVKEALTIASAQVKSAILFAGLNTRGQTTVVEALPSRDHSENMLAAFGAEISIVEEGRGRAITLTGQPELVAQDIIVPGDFSSSAFPLVAALLIPGDGVVINNVCLNSLRKGLLDTLTEMGAKIQITHNQVLSGEPVGNISVEFGPLKGVRVPLERAPKMIDEYPILAVAAACAEGETIFEGVAELRMKESDRLSAIARGLTACDVEVKETEDSIIIIGGGKAPIGGGHILSKMDHRIAMAFLVLGMVTEKPIIVDDVDYIDTSFPGFIEVMNGLGGDLRAGMEL